jgi:hypothetical protein
MGLFRRKAMSEDDSERCPRCRERLPEGAVECMMCGLALEPLLGAPSNEQANAPEGYRP